MDQHLSLLSLVTLLWPLIGFLNNAHVRLDGRCADGTILNGIQFLKPLLRSATVGNGVGGGGY
jgi:hypothetical protein